MTEVYAGGSQARDETVVREDVVKDPSPGTPGKDIKDMVDRVGLIAEKAEEGNYDEITGGWESYEHLARTAFEKGWNVYNYDYDIDRASAEAFDKRTREALLTLFATLKSAEKIVANEIRRIRIAVGTNYELDEEGKKKHYGLWMALLTQEGDEAQHDDGATQLYEKVAGIEPEKVEETAEKYNNFANKVAFSTGERIFDKLLTRKGREVPFSNVRLAIFTYGLVCEFAIAMGDMHIRRKNRHKNLLAADYEADPTVTDHLIEWLRTKLQPNGLLSESAQAELGQPPPKFPAIEDAQKNTAQDEGRHYGIAFLSTRDWLQEDEQAPEQIMLVVDTFLEVAGEMLTRGKQESRGLIDDYLRQGYGPNIDSLYYYTTLVSRVGEVLGSLHLKQEAKRVHEELIKMYDRFTDESGQPIVEERPLWLRHRKTGGWLLRSMGGKPMHVHALDRLAEYIDKKERTLAGLNT